MRPAHDHAYTLDEIAAAAGATPARVAQAVRASSTVVTKGFVAGPEAVAIVRELAGIGRRRARPPLTLVPEPRRHRAVPLVVSALAHGLVALALSIAATLGLLRAAADERPAPTTERARLVYLLPPGPGGGGGGGGLTMPVLPPKAERKAAATPNRLSSPVPKPAARAVPPRPTPPRPVVVTPPPPARMPPARPVPAPVLPVPPPAPPTPAATRPMAPVAPAVAAPVVSAPAEGHDRAGVSAESPGNSNSPGPGTGGGTGSGPYQPGRDIVPPQLLREVRAG